MSRSILVNDSLRVGAGEKLLLIAGPCQIESLEHALATARTIQEVASRYPVSFVYKSSFDKANRTSGSSVRGVGIKRGLEILALVKKEVGCPVLTDIHSPEQASLAGQTVDILQIPAFLCRQTDLLVAAAMTGKAINVKKGQFLAPPDMRFVVEKIHKAGNDKIMVCERGTTHGYRDLIVDPRSFVWMRDSGYPVIFDASHSVQSPGGLNGSSGGERKFIAPLARAAVAVGVDGVFVECHEDPDNAPSDGPSMLPLNELAALLDQLCAINDVRKKFS